MTDPEVPSSPPEAALSAQRVSCHVVGQRPPEPAVSRSFGSISEREIARFGAQIDCATTFLARRSGARGCQWLARDGSPEEETH